MIPRSRFYRPVSPYVETAHLVFERHKTLTVCNPSQDESPSSPENVAPLLEADFLRLALDTFWTRLYPSFSVVHQSTFRPHRYPLLTLSLACVGAVYIGNQKAQNVAKELYLHVKHRVIIQISEGKLPIGFDTRSAHRHL